MNKKIILIIFALILIAAGAWYYHEQTKDRIVIDPSEISDSISDALNF